MKFLLFITFSLFHSLTFAQTKDHVEIQIISSLEKINSTPISITFQNSLEINNNGGHLQGIQYLQFKQKDYYVLSGSSDTYSYYSIVKIGKENRVISTNKILEKPFKHAGGFQIYKNLMAIGVEDNNAKNKSKVFIFQLDNPEKLPEEPLSIIERMGTFKRATAGCVGITVINNKVLVVVGDWDTEHLDFYRIDRETLGLDGEALELEYSVNTKKLDKSGWSDDSWLSYQNINFIKDTSGNLYLAGMTSNDNGENVLDLYEIETEDLASFKLKKIYSKKFTGNKQTKFRWGAGIHVTEDMDIKLFSCGKNILNTSTIDIYR